MNYMLLLYNQEAGFEALPPDVARDAMAAYAAYSEALKSAGVFVSTDRLKMTSTATTVQLVDGKTSVVDGPYAETREQLGGYYLINVPDLDSALSWAARCPGASHGFVEVRPTWEM